MKRLAIVAVFVAVVVGGWWAVTTPAVVETGTLGGFIVRPQQLSGTITVVSDVYAAPWATLTFLPGTRVEFERGEDVVDSQWNKSADEYIIDHNDPTGREGYKKSHYALYGTVFAQGTAAQPIVFTSAQAKPDYADWDELILLRGSILDHVEVAYTHNGVNINSSDVRVMNSVIHDALWSCVDIFSTNNIVAYNEIYHCWHQAIGVKTVGENTINNNTIHDANLSINCENDAAPTIRNNTFTAAQLADNCPADASNTSVNRPVDTLGGTYRGELIYSAL
ncbi:MAG TPA: hypothetical protein DEG44_04965 [Candidatus Kerfeldbacteria bacterium]|nr:hypothetical protein [Candidatus Kerfeldbacteria bacterium]